jgi:PadR family transcriptional regulator
VLLALSAEPDEWRHGYELGQQVGLKAGSLYPILIRLADRELLEARWEDLADPTPGRPPRHLYRLTGSGRELAGQLAREASARDASAREATARVATATTATAGGRSATGDRPAAATSTPPTSAHARLAW